MMKKMLIINSTITPTLKHPMSLGTMMMIQTITMCMIYFKESKSSWVPYIMFITIIGGLMVMFMYMSSIASNEKFKPMSNKMLMMTLILVMINLTKEMETLISNKTMEMNKLELNQMEDLKTTSKFFNLNKMNITLMMIYTMFLTMMSITKISSSLKGPLKMTYV